MKVTEDEVGQVYVALFQRNPPKGSTTQALLGGMVSHFGQLRVEWEVLSLRGLALELLASEALVELS